MRQTKATIHQLAANIVNKVLADMQMDFPPLAKAVLTATKKYKEEWDNWLREMANEVEQVLLNNFDSQD